MSKLRFFIFQIPIIILIFIPLSYIAASAQPIFTGNVPKDFTTDTSVTIKDSGGIQGSIKDVGLPIDAPPGTVSGNNIYDIRFDYDPMTDTLYVGINMPGINEGIDHDVIAGDVDDDGDPSSTSSWLENIGGEDIPDFGNTESFAVFFDIDEDGVFDVIAGVPSEDDITGFTVAIFVGTPSNPAEAFGANLPDNIGSLYANPSAGEPDIEFTIENFTQLPISSGIDYDIPFSVNAFMGSFQDDGIGEDSVSETHGRNRVCFDLDQDGMDVCGLDCDDKDATVYQGAPELCDGKDNNCDNMIPGSEVDDDKDGYRICDGDCDDNDTSIYLGAPELCDAKDNDCDGMIPGSEVDDDKDGYRICDGDCNDNDITIYSGAPEICDGKDNDCNGLVPQDEADNDGDEYKVCDGDCHDWNSNTYPQAPEICDGKDNNCDLIIPVIEDDKDKDGYRICDGDCDDFDPTVYPGAQEICDGKDNDCDGVIFDEEHDNDKDGVMPCGCDCNDNDSTIYTGAKEICDGKDNNCDGIIPNEETIDADSDSYVLCEDCNDSNPYEYPGTSKMCSVKGNE